MWYASEYISEKGASHLIFLEIHFIGGRRKEQHRAKYVLEEYSDKSVPLYTIVVERRYV
jgi:hypothetical protein